MKRVTIILVAFIVVLSHIAASATELTGEARIRDGDTIIVAGVPIRLNGLHCQELGTKGGNSAARAIDKLTRNKVVSCKLNGEKTYDRMVGRCSVDGRDIGASLIADGYCARCPRYDRSGSYISAQRAAGDWPFRLPRYCY